MAEKDKPAPKGKPIGNTPPPQNRLDRPNPSRRTTAGQDRTSPGHRVTEQRKPPRDRG
jgi:hypothetical protein